MTSPYVTKELHRSVVLNPYQLNTDIYQNLVKNLSAAILGKCTIDGYVKKIYDIIEYHSDIIPPESFSGKVTYNVTFKARICIPVIGISIICTVFDINKSLIRGVNGPILAIIDIIKHSPLHFEISSSNDLMYKSNGKLIPVVKDDLIKIKITSIQFNINDTNILVLGTLENMASESEIKKYKIDIDDIKKEEVFVKPTSVNVDIQSSSDSSDDSDNESGVLQD